MTRFCHLHQRIKQRDDDKRLLGFIVSHRGIEANPEKINAIMNMEALTSIKDVQKLTGCMAALNRFLSMLGERGLPFIKLLKKQDKFRWSQEAANALEDLKQHHQSPPISRLQCQERNCSYILQPPHTSSARQLW